MAPSLALPLALPLTLALRLVLHADPAAGPVTGVMMIPLDRGSEAACPALEGYAASALTEFPGVRAVKTDQLFTSPDDPGASAQLGHAETAFRAGVRAYDARRDDEAERQLKGAIRQYARAAGALKQCGHLCEATALMAASLERRGDLEGAKAELLDLLALQPSVVLAGPRYRPAFQKLRTQVAGSAEAGMRSNVAISTQPGGAQVYWDGAPAGVSPLQLPAVSAGKHLLRIERAGFQVHGEVLEVTEEDVQLSVPLVATASYRTFQAEATHMAEELEHGQVGAAAQWGTRLGLSRVLVGCLRTSDAGARELLLTLVDVGGARRLGTRKMVFHDDLYGQLKAELGRAVTALLNGQGGPRRSTKGDPLDSRHGTESWSAEEKGGRHEADKPPDTQGDPLNRHSGTEGW